MRTYGWMCVRLCVWICGLADSIDREEDVCIKVAVMSKSEFFDLLYGFEG